MTVERLYVLFLLTRCTITLTLCKALVGNILYPVLAEYRFKPALLSLSIAIGFFIGVFVWGLSIDTWGRRCVFPPFNIMTTYGGRFRYVFNITLLIGGTFGVAAGGANSFVTLASLIAVLGMGAAGRPGLPFLRK